MSATMKETLEAMGYRSVSMPGASDGDFLLQDDCDGEGPYLAAWYNADTPPYPVLPPHVKEQERVEALAEGEGEQA